MTTVAAVFLRSNRSDDRTPNGVLWASEYRTVDGIHAYSVDYHHASEDVQATRFASSRATYGLIPGSKLRIEVTEVAGCHFATHVALDDDAEYPRCEDCLVLSEATVMGADTYLETLPRYLENAAEGRWVVLDKFEVSDAELRYSSDRPLLSIRCLTCQGEYALRTSGEREPAGIHCDRLRHSFAEL